MTAIMPLNAAGPARTRFGITLQKVYEGNVDDREHRANMFRSGTLPQFDAPVRMAAKWILAGSAFFLFVTLLSASAGASPGAVLFAMVVLVGAGAWAAWVLSAKKRLTLLAVNPYLFDRVLDHALDRSEPLAMDHLRFNLDEDVHAKVQFVVAHPYLVPEVRATHDGLVPDPQHRARTIHQGSKEDGRPATRFSLYNVHHIYANEAGLSYVKTEYDFIEQGRGEPRVVDSSRWPWRAVENLRVGEHSFTVQTFGGNQVRLPYVPDVYLQPNPAPPGPGGQWAQTPAQPPGAQPPLDWQDPAVEQAVKQMLQRARQRAQTFVNTVNSLRSEWEDRH